MGNLKHFLGKLTKGLAMDTNTRLGTIARFLWYKTAVPVFIERFLLAAMAAAFIAVVFVNPLSFDKIQRTTAALALIFGAAFFAQTLYRHTQSAAEKAEPKEGQTPKQKAKGVENLKIDIQELAFTEHEKDAVVFVCLMSVNNLGPPTVLTNFELYLETPGGKRIMSRPALVGQQVKLMRGDGYTIIYKRSDDLTVKTAQQPIPTGGSVTGYLLFIFGGLNITELDTGEFNPTVTFQDVTGQRYAAIMEGTRLVDKWTKPRSAPGTNRKVIPPKSKQQK